MLLLLVIRVAIRRGGGEVEVYLCFVLVLFLFLMMVIGKDRIYSNYIMIVISLIGNFLFITIFFGQTIIFFS